MLYDIITYPKGLVVVAADEAGIRQISFHAGSQPPLVPQDWRRGTNPALAAARDQLTAYFAGSLQTFDLPLAPEGTAFQQEVWHALQNIPYGRTLSYGELAANLGRPNASRAVGAANGQNPIAIAIPCHRVIGKNGKLTGYAGGLDIKAWLLDHERARAMVASRAPISMPRLSQNPFGLG